MSSQFEPSEPEKEVRFDLQPTQPYPGTPTLGQSQRSDLEVFAEAAASPPSPPRKTRPTYGMKTLPMPAPMILSDDDEVEQDHDWNGKSVWDAVSIDAASGGTPNVPYYLQLYGYDDEETVKTLRGIATGIYASRIAPAKRHLKKLKQEE